VAKAVDAARPAARDRIERAGLTKWDVEELPRISTTTIGGSTIRAYPALVDDGATVSVQLLSTPEDQALAHPRGVRRLLLHAIPSPLGYVQEHLTTQEKLTLAQSPYRTTGELFDDCLLACIDVVVAGRDIRTRAEFERARDDVSAGIVDALFRTVGLVARIVASGREVDRAIKGATSIALIAPLGDARSQLDALLHPGFVSRMGLARLPRLTVYLQGLAHRIDRLADNVGRDRVWMAEVQQATERYISAGGGLPLEADAPDRIVRARWMLEELRLSLFAQHLGADGPVSLQRITKVLADA
jgi:ATP-dependent helicase HrpA